MVPLSYYFHDYCDEVFGDDFEMGNIKFDVDNDHLQRESSFQINGSLQQNEFEKLKFDMSESLLSRNDIYKEMTNLYKHRGTLSKKLKNANSIYWQRCRRTWVTRDPYSVFYAELCKKFDGQREKMPNVMNFAEEDLETIGKISHHFYIQLGLFPFTFLRQRLNRLFLTKLTRQS